MSIVSLFVFVLVSYDVVSRDAGQLGEVLLEFVDVLRIFGQGDYWLLLIEWQYRRATENHLEGDLSRCCVDTGVVIERDEL